MNRRDILQVEKLTSGVRGMLNQRQGRFLYEAARKCSGRGVILEIGSFKGKSTIWLARGSQAGSGVKVYCVDPFIETDIYTLSAGESSIYAVFSKNIGDAGVSDLVVPYVGTSAGLARGWDKPIELLWIDGDHNYEGVRLDFDLWSPHLIEGGTIAFHDTLSREGPRRVLRDSIFGSRHFKNVGLVGEITYARKTTHGTPTGGVSAAYARFIINMCDIAVRRHLPRPIKKIGKKMVGL